MQDQAKNQAPASDCTVVLCTYNGAKFLPAQLDSIAVQSMAPDLIIASDDGSTDATVSLTQAFSDQWNRGQVIQFEGPRQGYSTNFLATLTKVHPETGLVALSDQDDIWHPEKLARAASVLKAYGKTPALYGAATWVCNAELEGKRMSRVTHVPLGFRHALGQNFAGGNTMVMNNAALRTVQRAYSSTMRVPVHDWWLYQVISGAGGEVIFDQQPCLDYRQHTGNEIGSATGITPILKRMRRMVRGDYRHWNSANLSALQSCASVLTRENRAVLEQVVKYRDAGLVKRLSLTRDPGLYRQGLLGQLGLLAALALNRF
ncbi:glycosyl transferase family 2 [Litoreibacter ponti]|uniref:Glycosyl transferase family 2 n=1 Tax=Litoreibacter ponti TaxID=1510457 RepID=A0A2T6BNT0_9RHOB|nr:glycosyltransferase [Litoreibacter ponti]PTX57725.1 glycosyl transferase family 2 [Litoreibacter ponti]